jgi:hypothetical protein
MTRFRLLSSNSFQLLLPRAAQPLYDRVVGNGLPLVDREGRAVTFLKMLRIVLWSFFGVRKGSSHQADMAAIKLPFLPLVAIGLAGGLGVFLFCLARFATTAAH